MDEGKRSNKHRAPKGNVITKLVLISSLGVGMLIGYCLIQGNNKSVHLEKRVPSSQISRQTSHLMLGEVQQADVNVKTEVIATKQDVPNKQYVDDGYNFVLNFADATRRLINYEPTYKSWQQTTSAPGNEFRPGRTDYNQRSFSELGGVPGDQDDERDDKMKDFNREYDLDSRTMMSQSIQYRD